MVEALRSRNSMTLPIEQCVEESIARAAEYLGAANTHGSPLYLLDTDVLRQRAREFSGAFSAVLPDVVVYYALKSNNLDMVVRTLVEEGLGVDVSSGVELEQALAAGASDIIFSGPGKTAAELDMAIAAADRVIVLLDSFGELERLQRQAEVRGTSVRAGVRLSTNDCGLWRKFGIPLGELGRFLEAASACGRVRFEGLQHHMSWSLDPDRQVGFIRSLGDELLRLPPMLREMIRFLDIGGGFWPSDGEWLHEDPAAMMKGGGKVEPGDKPATSLRKPPRPRVLPAASVDEFAAAIAAALREHVFPVVDCRIHLEPGRWLCHDAMHLLITAVDKKAEDLVIADAGTNAIGWERFESDYFPLINLSRPGLDEHVCTIFGSLCTPHDVWGFSYHGAGIEPGDLLLVPRQGAYTYSLRQHFIKPLPRVVARGPDGWTR